MYKINFLTIHKQCHCFIFSLNLKSCSKLLLDSQFWRKNLQTYFSVEKKGTIYYCMYMNPFLFLFLSPLRPPPIRIWFQTLNYSTQKCQNVQSKSGMISLCYLQPFKRSFTFAVPDFWVQGYILLILSPCMIHFFLKIRRDSPCREGGGLEAPLLLVSFFTFYNPKRCYFLLFLFPPFSFFSLTPSFSFSFTEAHKYKIIVYST